MEKSIGPIPRRLSQTRPDHGLSYQGQVDDGSVAGLVQKE